MKYPPSIGAALVAAASLPVPPAAAFVPPSSSSSSSSPSLAHAPPPPSSGAAPLAAQSLIQEDLAAFVPPDVAGAEISEPLCRDAASRMESVRVPVPASVSPSGTVGVSYVRWPADPSAARKFGPALPLLLVHGFDSSSLEYRRLGPALSAMGVDVYAVDLLGWGYTQLRGVDDFSAQAKVEALRGFWREVGGDREVVAGGASLGGAATIEFAAAHQRRRREEGEDGDDGDDGGFVRGTVLIDAQGFVDGIGPMSFLPAPLARAGIRILKSVPLRSSANQMSYHDPGTYATDDALRVGRLHCLRDGWEDGMLSFMQSGGFRPKEKVPLIDVPSLVLWGRQDGILDGAEFANKFVENMPDARLEWIEECGHVPHLEQPEVTAERIAAFLRSEAMRPSGEAKASAALGKGILDGLFDFLN